MLRTVVGVGFALATGAAYTGAAAETGKAFTGYTETTFQKVKAAPEDFRNDKITYTGRFLRFYTTFLRYMEESGFKADRYYGLIVNEVSVPVMARKNTEMKQLMGMIRPLSMVRVYGRLKKFRRDPNHPIWPRYYLELAHLEFIQTAGSAEAKTPGKDAAKPPLPRRHRRRRR
jgi:hypothetical protein